MSVFLTVISFPFWFFGLFFVIAALFGEVKGPYSNTTNRLVVLMIGIILTIIAYGLVFVGR